MSTMISSKQMETKLYALVECLAANYGFDADEAFEFTRWETDVDHVGEILKVVDKNVTSEKPVNKKTVAKKDDVSESPPDTTTSDLTEKIAVCRKNIELWQNKLSDGKSKDADKQREKIDKEQKKLDKLLEKMPVPKPEPKKSEPKKPEVKEKRIKRFSPTMASQLKTVFEGLKVELTDKLKKEFQQYVEDLTDDDYRNEGLSDHMRSFAKTKVHSETVRMQTAAEDTEPENEIVINSESTVVDVTLTELQNITMTATVNTGTFWDADNGRLVKGPESDDDEDFEEKVFEGTNYVVGEKTGRVYEARDTGDVFAGFIGVGRFKTMTK
jgi:hypothetical protein